MLEADSASPVPSTNDLTRFWQEIDFAVSNRAYPFMEEYVRTLRERYANGRVLFASFECRRHAVIDWYMSRNNLQGLLFFHRFWHTPTPASILSELKVSNEQENDPRFEPGDSFTFAGKVASRLYQGGAYHRPTGSGVEEMRLAERAAYELIQDRFAEVLVFVSHAAWTRFFFGIGWDDTWLLLDKRERLVHVLAATDTD
jgi:hypothetical protein